jgi:DNA-binding phage protein
MTTRPQTARPKPVRRANADYRWTKSKVTAFLRALARCGKVAEAARSVGMSRQSAYELKARLADPRFQHMWALAIRTGLAARAEARAAAWRARMATSSPWGEAGLAGLAHLRGGVVQADTLPAQADTLARKVTF